MSSNEISGMTVIEERMQNVEKAVNRDDESNEKSDTRRIYINGVLPPEALDEDGNPAQHFARNKIRTARYTPLTFVPKNLWLQFHNVANIYFLFITILAFFPIFGASNPALGSVPLIVILLITAVKDAIEDYRRTVLDNELNNTPVMLLEGWTNINVTEESISHWRRFKKATTRNIRTVIKFFKGQVQNGSKSDIRIKEADPRQSICSISSQYAESIQLTGVPAAAMGQDDGNPTSESLSAAGNRSSQRVKRDLSRNGMNPSIIDTNVPSQGAKFKSNYWKNVRVGDFVRLRNDEEIPADIIVLSTSDPDGACFIETKNLDGETNLKVRYALQATRSVRTAGDCERATFVIDSEPPHANLYAYSGVLRWKEGGDSHTLKAEKAEAVSINNLLLRGCTLRNTKWAIGVVVFTGDETKIMMNAGITPSKRSNITRQLNWNVIVNFIILLIMCLVSGIVQGVTWARGSESLDFFEYGSIGGSPPVDGIITFWTAVILFQNLVPISLYISIEIVKLAQAFFIYSDVNMYYDKIDYPCTPKSWNISDDLGQIEYIFSDKTGTLTQNVMEFKKCTINGKPYGEAYTEAQMGMQKREGIDVATVSKEIQRDIAANKKAMFESLQDIHKNKFSKLEQMTFVSLDFAEDMKGASGDLQSNAAKHFMLALSLCHTVLPEISEDNGIVFKAQSPDEAALVATAKDCGFTVLKRSTRSVTVNVFGLERDYEVLNTIEFNSTRKRMSVIIRMPDTRKIFLFCKGADSVVYSRLKPGIQSGLRQTTAEHLEIFAREGLRTLCLAEREIPEAEYLEWNSRYESAASAVQDREEKLEAVADEIEQNLILLGGTAIEDRLQEGVPDTIALFVEAGIKLWVLTGDKVETAINIGFSCNLLDNSLELIVIKKQDLEETSPEDKLQKLLSEMFSMYGDEKDLEKARNDHSPPTGNFALVVDGEALKEFLEPALKSKFLLLCKQCKAVLCCRVSPSQKAAVVQMVKTGLNVMTLSVGDGANDVAMIQEADVGVGIAGEEGRQAVMCSDYAIGQFKFLSRLILVHGRWSYRRLAEMIANFFYKNIVWTLALFWYQLYNNFDGSYLFEYTYILLYNLAFTSVPIVLLGILDQDVDEKVSLAVPQLYRRGMLRQEWTQHKFWLYMLDGCYQSLACFFTTYFLFAPGGFVSSNGVSLSGREQMGVYVACATVFVVNAYVLINQYRWDWLSLTVLTISILLVWFWTGIYSQFQSTGAFYQTVEHVFGALSFWAITLLTVTVCLLPRMASKAVQKLFYPRDVDIIREQVRLGVFDGGKSDGKNSATGANKSNDKIADDERPIYPPSIAATATTYHKRSSNNGSEATDFSNDSEIRPIRKSLDHRISAVAQYQHNFERIRASMDRPRPSLETTRDFTSAVMLARVESTQSHSQIRKR